VCPIVALVNAATLTVGVLRCSDLPRRQRKRAIVRHLCQRSRLATEKTDRRDFATSNAIIAGEQSPCGHPSSTVLETLRSRKITPRARFHFLPPH
jgi:hypothetical protein